MDYVFVKAKPAYSAVHVNSLVEAIFSKCSSAEGSRFFCLTDDPSGVDQRVECIELTYDVAGWWHKIQVFEFSAKHNNLLCYIDLDTAIVGDLKFLENYSGDFALLRDFYRPDGYQSSVMLINNGFGKSICEPFYADAVSAMQSCAPGNGPTWGDQRWIEMRVNNADLLQDLFPGKILSFKVDVAATMQPAFSAAVICYHGNPRPQHFRSADIGRL